MVKNLFGGNKAKKQKRNTRVNETVDKLDAGQMFGQVTSNNGNHFMILCTDNITRHGKLRGTMKKGVRLIIGLFVVISLREFEAEQNNCDIIGIGNPPHDIINLFKTNNPVKYDNDIEFYESDDEFNEFEESKHTGKDNNINNDNNSNSNSNTENDIDWDAL